MPLKFTEHYTPQDCASHRDWLFVFGDNFLRKGKGGQAVIRDEENAVGIATKKRPSMKEDAFLADADYDEWEAFNAFNYARLESYLAAGGVVVWPTNIGMGRAELPARAGKIYTQLVSWAWGWRDRYGRAS